MRVEHPTGPRIARRAALLAAAVAAIAASPLLQAEPAAQAQAAPAAAAAALDLKFSQFFKTPIGPAGLALSDALRGADGRQVRLVGYMVAQEDAKPGRFWFTPRPVRMSEHADGEADDLPASTVTVLLDPAQKERLVAHRDGLVVLTGTLSVGRFEDETGRVSWVRLQLAPGALETQASADAKPAGHGH
ncbi:MAG: hypothetical protein J7598_04345 [Mitsuaria chitosanitabida]|jgi:hypothetical protein|uniref:hypothetical protein n=1 Tax=Roseateles chitosanitabidus TaxID=65048 RepID=UPI001B08AE91|nr:hypothetical protein [Roseateles chitosanitabidus]MBO9685820.1 hypothetical protein [Roseateles chitosanitabidus]